MKNRSFFVAGALLLASLFTTSCKELASNFDQPVSSYLENKSAALPASVPIGTTYQIEATSISTEPIQYESSNPDVAIVDKNGLVTAVADGDATITVSVDQDPDKAYLPGKFEVKVAVRTPLSFEAQEDGQVFVNFYDIVLDSPIYYSIIDTENKVGEKVAITNSTSIDVKTGEVVQFESANDHMAYLDDNYNHHYVSFYTDHECAVYGNVMSLITDGDFNENVTIAQPWALAHLFDGASYIVPSESIKLRLPATTLTDYCYQSMFAACWGLTEAPELPATKMAWGCYAWMFSASGLKEAPALPAMELAGECYWGMFNWCFNLTKAPELPATELTSGCYAYMFQYCGQLQKAPALPAKNLPYRCYSNMFRNTGLTEAPAITAETVDGYACEYMFNSCSSMTKANTITINEIAYFRAFQDMFGHCSSLTESPAIIAKDLSNYACAGMFFNCVNMTKAKPITVQNTIDVYAFNYMYENCSELTESPAITAETIGDRACQNMFYNSKKLKKANAINAKTVGNSAFSGMFSGQPELTEAVAVNAETMGEWACNGMFYNCPQLTKVPATLPAQNLALGCYQSMFESCTSLTEAPELPAETLANQCYAYMFYGCSKLNKVKCLAKTNESYYSLYYWLYNAGTDESITTRTFTRSEDNNNWVVTDNIASQPDDWYVPTGWTITPTIEALSAPAAQSARAASTASVKLATPVKEDAQRVNNTHDINPALSNAKVNLPDFIKNRK